MRVCAIQMDVARGDRAANHATVRRLTAEAVRRYVPDVIVLPELWSTGYALEHALELASPHGSVDAIFLSELAREFGVSFAGGSVLASCGADVFNRAQVIGRDGQLLACYDKMHLFRLMDEDRYLSAGTVRSFFALEGAPCAAVICYDIRFCELPRRLALDGAEILFVSAEWPASRLEHWRTLLRARAIENQMFVVACNRCGVTEGTSFGGHSTIIAPDGAVLAEADGEESIICADIDLTMVRRVRDAIPVFRDRVPEYYL